MKLAILLVMLGGGLGAVIRAFITNICNEKFNSAIPIATSIVNILGSFLGGITLGSSNSNDWISPFFITGVLGGLTTFSTLTNELVHFMTPNFKLGHFIGYSLLQFLIGFIACYIGFHL
ncbi:fluoride efflux transporter FluC [Staphylococcus capitis]|uniref:fluoride efflux transporter FluC n=1 Tax=Staphylococcus capitis TaxID=29388 RepID=UPI00248173CB|nr:CrcB family protein [Staphylococcus capitis]MDH9599814.1 CrcB family protein [Staphylococcus capitis]MDH9622810.1 CrcB family protein [Staphylococcus capitis]MDS4061596.1 CrcB family protein [Staphylococcus capitis]